MTYEKALEIAKGKMLELVYEAEIATGKRKKRIDEEFAMLMKACEAMEKQMPIKLEKTESGTFYICSNCDKIVSKNEPSHGNLNIPYCKWCGHAWDWSDVK